MFGRYAPLLLLCACSAEDGLGQDLGGNTTETGGPQDTTQGQTDNTTGDATDTSGGTSDASAVLPECEGETPFTSEDCGRALKELCRAQTSEQDCVARGPFVLQGQYTFLCGWAKVVTFSDTVACEVNAVVGRCEAGIIPGDIGCDDPCDFETGQDINKSLTAIVSESELIEMPCAPGGYLLSGPIDESAALSNQQGDPYAHLCGADSPPPPQICDCSAAACEAGSR